LKRKLVSGIVIGSLLALYPLGVWLGLSHGAPAWALGAALLVLLLLRWGRALRQRLGLGGLLAVAAVAALLVWAKADASLRFYPVLVNAAGLALFGASLRFGPPVIERLARLQHPDLDETGVRYTRKVTQLWCGFFVLNGGIAAATALWADDKTWALYNGLISYILMGCLLGGERLWRLRAQRRAA
jgi:uncharacterized membrane protein